MRRWEKLLRRESRGEEAVVKGLDHIAIIVSSEKSISFYEMLGFLVVERIQRSYDEVVFMEHAGITLEIFIDASHPDRINNPEANGLRHLALRVSDVETMTAKLHLCGIETEEIRPDWHGRKFTFVKDPDGQPIELKE